MNGLKNLEYRFSHFSIFNKINYLNKGLEYKVDLLWPAIKMGLCERVKPRTPSKAVGVFNV